LLPEESRPGWVPLGGRSFSESRANPGNRGSPGSPRVSGREAAGPWKTGESPRALVLDSGTEMIARSACVRASSPDLSQDWLK